MKRRFTGQSNTGKVRSVNQDAYYHDPEGRFFIVADGMGGHAGGQEASKIATEEIQAYLNEHWNSSQPSDILLKEALLKANQSILDDQSTHPQRGDMGTTVIVLMFREQECWQAHIGDSRLYRLRGKELEQLSEDHTWVAKAMKAGDISKDDAKHHPWRHVLSQCLGRKDIYTIDIEKLAAEVGDVFLLCSDGLTEEVSDELISTALQDHHNPEQAATELIKQALQGGGSDNVTVIVVAQD